MARPRKLPPDRAAELVRRYELYRSVRRQHGPKVLCAEFGVHEKTLGSYAARARHG